MTPKPYHIKVFSVFFYSIIFPFLQVSSPFGPLDWGLTLVRATASYLNEGDCSCDNIPSAVYSSVAITMSNT